MQDTTPASPPASRALHITTDDGGRGGGARSYLASFPGLSGEGGKAWGLLRAHARKLPQNVVIAYYSNLSATFVSILSVKAWERG